MPVKQKNMMVGALAAVMVLVVWYMFLYSPMTAQKSKAQKAAAAASSKAKSLQTEINSFKASIPAKSQQTKQLTAAIPASPSEAAFFRDLDGIKKASGVTFQSAGPNAPTSAGQLSTINVTISVQGTLAQVEDYVSRLEGLKRLFVIDNLSLTPQQAATAGGSTGGASSQGGPTGKYFAGTGSAPSIGAQITGRIFTQAVTAPAVGSLKTSSVGVAVSH